MKMASENCRQIASCLQIEAEKAWRRSEPERAGLPQTCAKLKATLVCGVHVSMDLAAYVQSFFVGAS